MFGMGWMEILVVLVLALVVLGPERMVGVARSAGRVLRELRQTTEDVAHNLSLDEEPQESDGHYSHSAPPSPASPEGSQPRTKGEDPPAPPAEEKKG